MASETRCSILISLANKPAKLSSLARGLNITAQEAFRNINRLAEAGLVKKWGRGDVINITHNNSTFHLTEVGRLLIKEIPYFVVLRKHQEFLKEHTFKDIPDKFVQRMGVLQNCEAVRNVTVVFEKLKKLESGARSSQHNGISGMA
ncbi:MAG: helix-turn-helix domain-containing protein [Nitrososphaeraceae archaeon]